MRSIPFRGLALAALLAACNTVIGADGYVADQPSGPPAPKSCGTVAPDPQLVRGCVLNAGCPANLPGSTLSRCISNAVLLGFENDNELMGIAYASNCSDTYIFSGSGKYKGSCATGEGWKCDGSKAVRCDVSPPVFYDCTERIATCDPNAPANKTNTIPCVVPDHTCTGTEKGCAGDVIYNCVAGKAWGLDCSLAGDTCALDANGDPTCVLKATGCGADRIACSGTDISACSSDAAYTYHCGKAGLGCVEENGNHYCLAAGCHAKDLDACAETCSGATANVCIGAVPYAIECTQYGFSTCAKKHTDKLGDFVICTD